MRTDGNSIGSSFPLIFFNGNTESNLGSIVIPWAVNFKEFQSIVREKVGISPNQMTIYLEKNSPSSSSALHHSFKKYHRKVPVTCKTDFASILDDPNIYFRAVVKRSRRSRRRRREKQSIPMVGEGQEECNDGYSMGSGNASTVVTGGAPPPGTVNGFPIRDHLEYANGNRVLDRKQARYLSSLNLNSDPDCNVDPYWRERQVMMIDDVNSASSRGGSGYTVVVVCEVCDSRDSEETASAFHCCKYDPVTVWFCSTAGPIARPRKLPPPRGGN